MVWMCSSIADGMRAGIFTPGKLQRPEVDPADRQQAVHLGLIHRQLHTVHLLSQHVDGQAAGPALAGSHQAPV